MAGRKTGWVIAVAGYLLSPLSWWNDLYVNVPLAYLFSIPFTLINERLFTASFLLGYWLSNLIGLLMLQWGGARMSGVQRPVSWRWNILSTLIYSLLLVALVMMGWLPSPTELMHFVRQSVGILAKNSL